jgi:hypothetical protein
MAMVPSGHPLCGSFEKLGISMQTNLHDIIQNTDERITILKSRRHASFIISLWEDYPLLERLELGSLGSHPLDCCQGRQEGLLLQPE